MAVALVILSSTLAGCGLSLDERTIAIADGDLPNELNEPTTTTTTSPPTTAAATTVPVTTVPSAPPTVVPTSVGEDDAPIAVDVYYPLAGSSDEMYVFPGTIAPPGGLERLIEVLTNPAVEARQAGLRTALGSGFILGYDLDRGVLSVDLAGAQYDRMDDYKKRQAIAQMVLSFSSYAPPGEGGIAQVAFSVDGEPTSVQIPNQGASNRGEGIFFADFASLIRELEPATETTASFNPFQRIPDTPPNSSAPPTTRPVP